MNDYEEDEVYHEYEDMRDHSRFEGLSMDEIESLLEDEAVSKSLQEEALSSWAY
jgi:hypothetical protein